MRNRKIFLTIVILIVFATVTNAQTIDITGTVVEKKTNKTMPGVLVFLKIAGSNGIKAYTQTSPTGNFKIAVPKEKNQYHLEFSLLGYAKQILPLADITGAVKIAMQKKAVNIKEVKIKSPKIRQKGDTISYNVASFAQTQDKTIGDVLKKIPGIEVEKSGAIKYNGKPINKFYVEGLDLLEGRYGIATNGIPQQEVSRVEVMQNHQPVKALEDFTFSDNAAINIKLKKGAKQHWIGTTKLGAGCTPFLWSADILGMRFAKKSQSMNTYKTNNTGADIIGETSAFNLIDLLPSDTRYTPNNYLSLSPKSTSAIGKHRLRFNKTHVASTTQLWKLKKDYELKGQLIYTNNSTDYNSITATKYFRKNDTISIEEQETAKQHTETLNFATILTANTKKFYIKNKLESKINWHTTNFDINGTYPTYQQGKIPNFNICNTFDMVKRTGKKAISINSYNKFYRQKQQLKVQQNSDKINQDITNSGFFSNTEIDYGINLKTATISITGGFSALTRKLNHQLLGDLPSSFSQNDYQDRFSYITPYVKPILAYNGRYFKAKLKLPIHYYHYNYKNKVLKNNQSQLLFSPNLSMSYYISSKFIVNARGNINKNPVAENLFYQGAILSNYRLLQSGFPNYNNSKSKSVSLGLEYRNPIDMLFANVSVMKFWNRANKVIERNFIDKFTVFTYVPYDKNMATIQVNSRVSKGLDFFKGLLNISANYRSSDSEMYQQKTAIAYTSTYFSIKPSVTTQLATWSNAEYKFSYAQNRFKIENQTEKNTISQMQHELVFNFMPSSRLRMSLSGEYYHNEIATDSFKDLLMIDTGVAYTLKNGIELSIALNNILNEKQYAYSITGDLSTTYNQYKIRSRSLFVSLYFKL